LAWTDPIVFGTSTVAYISAESVAAATKNVADRTFFLVI